MNGRALTPTREVMTARPVKMRILSDDFFVPWGLFYFPPHKPAGPRTLAFWDGFGAPGTSSTMRPASWGRGW
jgi:hypothetical protein